MKTTKGLYVHAAVLAVAASMLLFAGARGPARADSTIVLEGTGTFTSTVVRTSVPLDPPCVSLVTRVGTVAFTGFITAQTGNFESHALRDACAAPVQGPTSQTYELLNATIGGKTGQLVIQADGIFEGDATVAPGARSRYHLTISGVGGDLKGAVGEGQSVGLATTSASSNTYYVTITLKK